VEKVSFEPEMNSECVTEGKNHKQILSRTKTRNADRKFQGAKVPRSTGGGWERMVLGAKSPVTVSPTLSTCSLLAVSDKLANKDDEHIIYGTIYSTYTLFIPIMHVWVLMFVIVISTGVFC